MREDLDIGAFKNWCKTTERETFNPCETCYSDKYNKKPCDYGCECTKVEDKYFGYRDIIYPC